MIIENKKIYDFLTQKEVLVKEGRDITDEIIKLEEKIAVLEKKEKSITGKVRVDKALQEKGEELTKEINTKMKELEVLGKEIEEAKLNAIPADMKKKHFTLLDEKEVLERSRNKIALKIQKIKDRVIPTIQKVVKPLLKDEYDDIETAKIKDGKIVITTFNYLQDWKAKFHK